MSSLKGIKKVPIIFQNILSLFDTFDYHNNTR